MKTLFSKLPPNLAASAAARLREWLFPVGCSGCGKVLPGGEAEYGLCASCARAITMNRGGDRCSLCSKPLISEMETCLSCRNGSRRFFDRILSLFPYAGTGKTVLQLYKFGRRPWLGNFLVQELRLALPLLLPVPVPESAWVPVPPRPGKLKSSGWDQIEHLAKLLERTKAGPPGTGPLPVCRCLRRLPSESQKKLNRESRQQNLRGRIIACGNQPPGPRVPRTAVIFDDVYTTGSTMDACAEALKAAGTEQVYGICLFYD